MTNERKEEAGPVTVQIGVCSVCHALFLLSGERLTSPCHGSDTLAVLATLTIGPDAQVTGEWGLGAPIGEPDITDEPALAIEEEPAPPAAEAPEEAEEGEIDNAGVLLEGIKAYLSDAGIAGDDVHTWLTRMGAEPEAASTAVGRLSAVRELLEQLSAAREPAPVAPVPSEAESSPENT